MRIARAPALAFVALLAFLALPSRVHADPLFLNCETGCNFNLFGGAFWTTGNLSTATGTGNFNPFVRLQAEGQEVTEDGVNTSGPLLNNEKDGIWTHDVKVSQLNNVVQVGQFEFYEFMLDLGEPSADNKSKLTLDDIQICTAAVGGLNAVGMSPCAPNVYNLDSGGVDRSIKLDYDLIGGGNGNSDLFLYLPKAMLAGVDPNAFFYFYTAFGYQPGYTADGSFEEWAFRSNVGINPQCPDCPPPGDDPDPPNPVPEPATLVLLGSGLAATAYKARRSRKV